MPFIVSNKLTFITATAIQVLQTRATAIELCMQRNNDKSCLMFASCFGAMLARTKEVKPHFYIVEIYVLRI